MDTIIDTVLSDIVKLTQAESMVPVWQVLGLLLLICLFLSPLRRPALILLSGALLLIVGVVIIDALAKAGVW